MKSVLEGELRLEDALPFVDRCLGCLACITVCPSGVAYGELVTPFRAYARGQVAQPFFERLQRSLINQTLPYPDRFRSAARLGRLGRPVKSLLPKELSSMLEMLPERLPASARLPEFTPAIGQRRARVALLTGCVQQVLAPEINWATLRVLANFGVEVVIPPGQGCCGAILMHTGEEDQARQLAMKNMTIFPGDVDAILTNAAGCGSGMKDYPLLFAGRKEEQRARHFAGRVQDISEFLDSLAGPLKPKPLPQPMRVAYHDACHLAHAQGVTAAPRRLLAAIPNLTLLEIADGNICCGSAGVYNLEQPEIAVELGQRKAAAILASGAEAIVAGNIGCIVQIRKHLQALGKVLPVFHTLELLDLAYGGANGTAV